MKFFLDTANLNEIREAADLGLADGVTTNPTLISKEGNVDFKQHIAAICEIVQGPVAAEVTSQDKDGMLREGREYSKIAPNVVIKCPLTREGLKATRELSDQGIRINVTLCFSAAQAVLAAKAGASFISPFLGRLDDIGQNGLVVLQEIIEIYQNYSWKTEVLAASLRHPIHVIEAARMGADIATMPFKVVDRLFNHPLTDKGQAPLLADWAKSGRKSSHRRQRAQIRWSRASSLARTDSKARRTAPGARCSLRRRDRTRSTRNDFIGNDQHRVLLAGSLVQRLSLQRSGPPVEELLLQHQPAAGFRRARVELHRSRHRCVGCSRPHLQDSRRGRL